MYLRLWGRAITGAVSNACTILNANLTPLSHAIGDKAISNGNATPLSHTIGYKAIFNGNRFPHSNRNGDKDIFAFIWF
jgi:hypothetical protein